MSTFWPPSRPPSPTDTTIVNFVHAQERHQKRGRFRSIFQELPFNEVSMSLARHAHLENQALIARVRERLKIFPHETFPISKHPGLTNNSQVLRSSPLPPSILARRFRLRRTTM